MSSVGACGGTVATLMMYSPDGPETLPTPSADGVGNVSGPSGEYIINVATVPPQAPTLDTVYDDVAPHADYLQKGDGATSS